MRVKNIPVDGNLGDVVHVRLTKKTQGLFKKEAKRMHLPMATYVRVFIEEMIARHKEIVTIAN